MEAVKLILASASPRRLEIIKKLGAPVEVKVSGADEQVDITQPEKLVLELSRRKALSVMEDMESGGIREPICIIGADTVVSLDGDILGKPADKEEAFRMLRALSGRTHRVYTGVSIVCPAGGISSFYEMTEVDFIELTDSEIHEYIASGDPLDKAGAYGVQSGAARFVSGIRGDFYNVMGLPLSRLYRELKNIGILGDY